MKHIEVQIMGQSYLLGCPEGGQAQCRAAVNLAAGTEGRTIESCMAGEDEARKGLAKDRSRIPIAERNQCIATMAKGGFQVMSSLWSVLK